jgi:hypothetical protein
MDKTRIIFSFNQFDISLNHELNQLDPVSRAIRGLPRPVLDFYDSSIIIEI